MVLSNEPGYYVPGKFGIRLENLLVVQCAENSDFLYFDTLTLCPFDRRLICLELLSPAERQWLNDYHQKILDELKPFLRDACLKWLIKACSTL